MIEKPLHRYTNLDSGSLCRLFRSDNIFKETGGDDFMTPERLMSFIDFSLRNPTIFYLGRDPRYEAFIFSPLHNSVTFLGHTAVRKDHRDNTVSRRAAEAAKWLFQNTPCLSIMGFTRESNRLACMLNGAIGMKRIGKTDKTVRYDGKLENEVIYQCTKDDYNTIWGDTLGRV
jgi:hypothetical protein